MRHVVSRWSPSVAAACACTVAAPPALAEDARLHPRAHVAQLGEMRSSFQPPEYGLRRPSLPKDRAPNAMLLISDVDGTLTGDAEALKAFKLHWLEEQLPRGSILCYNTARSMTRFVDGIHVKELPDLLQPDVLITGDGTEMWFFDSEGAPQLCQQWASHVREHWDLEQVSAVMTPLDDGSIGGLNDGEYFRRSITTSPGNRELVAAAIRNALAEHVEVIAMDSIDHHIAIGGRQGQCSDGVEKNA